MGQRLCLYTKETLHRNEGKMTGKRQAGSCEQCNNYVYDDDYECYICEMDLDEDEMARFLADELQDCPYYRPGDEYLVVRKQI